MLMKKSLLLIVLLILVTLVSNPIFATNSWVAIDMYGHFYHSNNGVSWSKSPITQKLPKNWSALSYGNGHFVAIRNKDGGINSVVSNDGLHWKILSDLNANTPFNSLTYCNGFFFSQNLKPSAQLLISKDGLDWGVFNPKIKRVNFFKCYNNNLFVNSDNAALTKFSYQNNKWSFKNANLSSNFTIENVNSLAFGNDLYLLSSDSADNKILTSMDGINWTEHAIKLNMKLAFSKIVFGNGLFLAIGYPDNNYSFETKSIYISKDGLNWKNYKLPFTFSDMTSNIAFNSGVFLMADESGLIMSSVDGIHWQTDVPKPGNPPGSPTAITSLKPFKNGFFLNGLGSSYEIDKVHNKWTLNLKNSFGASTASAIGNDLILYKPWKWAPDNGAPVATQIEINQQYYDLFPSLNTILWYKDHFIAAGSSIATLSSNSWEAQKDPLLNAGVDKMNQQMKVDLQYPNYISIHKVNNKVVLLTDSGDLVTKAVDNTWQKIETAPIPKGSSSYLDFAYGNGKYVFLTNGSIVTSSDLKTWQIAKSLPKGIANNYTEGNIIYRNGHFVAFLDYAAHYYDHFSMPPRNKHDNNISSIICTSKDGLHWTLRAKFTDFYISQFIISNDHLLAIGGNNHQAMMVGSSDDMHWNKKSLLNIKSALILIAHK